MKEFLRDEKGTVINCSRNLSQMNLCEWLWYFGKEWVEDGVHMVIDELKEGIPLIVFAVINLLFLIIFPISLLIAGWFSIRSAKKEVKEIGWIYKDNELMER